MRSVVSKRWPTRPFSLNILGSEEDRNSFGKILPKVGIYPRHWYSESLNYTCFRELNVLFLWVAYVNMSQARSKDSWKWNSILQVQVDVPDMKGESGVKAGSKQDPKTFKSSSNLGIKVQFNRRKLLVRSSFLFWVRFLRQDRKSGFSISLFWPLVRDRNWTWERLDF